MSDRIINLALIALLAVSTGLFAHKNYFSPAPGSVAATAPVFLENWREIRSAGLTDDTTATVQIIEFVDFECPFCASFTQTTLPALREKYDIGFTLVHFPLPGHRFALTAANMVECARAEGRFSNAATVLLAKQDSFGLKPWKEYAVEAGIANVPAWQNCVDSGGGNAVIERGKAVGASVPVTGTPTLLINGWKVPPLGVEDLNAAIRNILAGKSPF